MRLLRARGLSELGQVASGSATQSLWLGNRKMRSQVVVKDRSKLSGSGRIGEGREGGRRASNRTHRFGIRFRRDKLACSLPYLSLGFGNDRQDMSGGNAGVTIFITSMRGSKSFTSSANSFFHFRRPSGLRLAFDTAEMNENFCRIQC